MFKPSLVRVRGIDGYVMSTSTSRNGSDIEAREIFCHSSIETITYLLSIRLLGFS